MKILCHDLGVLCQSLVLLHTSCGLHRARAISPTIDFSRAPPPVPPQGPSRAPPMASSPRAPPGDPPPRAPPLAPPPRAPLVALHQEIRLPELHHRPELHYGLRRTTELNHWLRRPELNHGLTEFFTDASKQVASLFHCVLEVKHIEYQLFLGIGLSAIQCATTGPTSQEIPS